MPLNLFTFRGLPAREPALVTCDNEQFILPCCSVYKKSTIPPGQFTVHGRDNDDDEDEDDHENDDNDVTDDDYKEKEDGKYEKTLGL